MDSYDYTSYRFLKQCLSVEVIKSNDKKFSWRRAMLRSYKCHDRRFIFWWRIASFLHHKNHSKLANYINRKISLKYGAEINLNAKIKPGISFAHLSGVIITGLATIGENCHIRQNTTIGVGGSRYSEIKNKRFIIIGDNVEIGAHSCIIGNTLTIGNNVIIGAMSFINKNIPDNCTCYTKKENILIINNA